MGFAEVYLQKAGLREALVGADPHTDLKLTITVPVYNESGLERCLDSLLGAADSLPSRVHAEVLILINASGDSSPEILELNKQTYRSTRSWMDAHPHPSIDFHLLKDHSFGAKEAGVGLARKILMDEAVRRFDQIGFPDGILASLDADAVVEDNYLEVLSRHFQLDKAAAKQKGTFAESPEGCAIYFEHPLAPEDLVSGTAEFYMPPVFKAITLYELHLRYYLQAVRYTAYPYAYHTVGSAFAVRADVYCKEGGMNRRQGGEDFYFIQKIAQRGKFSDCLATRVIPSPRPSDRVPFGTGPVVARLITFDETLTTYDPRSFKILRLFFAEMETLYTQSLAAEQIVSLPDVLRKFLDSQKFEDALKEIRGNSASYPAFQKRFWRWFTMFRIMKFLHFARERGYPDVPVEKAAIDFLKEIPVEGAELSGKSTDLSLLLDIYRKRDRSDRTYAH